MLSVSVFRKGKALRVNNRFNHLYVWCLRYRFSLGVMWIIPYVEIVLTSGRRKSRISASYTFRLWVCCISYPPRGLLVLISYSFYGDFEGKRGGCGGGERAGITVGIRSC